MQYVSISLVRSSCNSSTYDIYIQHTFTQSCTLSIIASHTLPASLTCSTECACVGLANVAMGAMMMYDNRRSDMVFSRRWTDSFALYLFGRLRMKAIAWAGKTRTNGIPSSVFPVNEVRFGNWKAESWGELIKY